MFNSYRISKISGIKDYKLVTLNIKESFHQIIRKGNPFAVSGVFCIRIVVQTDFGEFIISFYNSKEGTVLKKDKLYPEEIYYVDNFDEVIEVVIPEEIAITKNYSDEFLKFIESIHNIYDVPVVFTVEDYVKTLQYLVEKPEDIRIFRNGFESLSNSDDLNRNLIVYEK